MGIIPSANDIINNGLPAPKSSPTAVKEYRIASSGIRATFIPYGARLVSLQVPDRGGEWREVNVGCEPEKYVNEERPSYLGAVIGRYANRIGKSQFTVEGQTFDVTPNDNDGRNTLHGGGVGYDAREWTVVAANDESVTFSLIDRAFEGFPGNVLAVATYTATPGKLTVTLTGQALDHPTPIMLTTHAYFNLHGDKQSPIVADKLQVPQGRRVVEVDEINVPTGKIRYVAGIPISNPEFDPFNFTEERQIGDRGGVVDNCFILEDCPPPNTVKLAERPQVIYSSPSTGIRLQVRTNQPAVQLYHMSTVAPALASQLGVADSFGCLAIEPQGWIDAINNPEWGHNQIYSPQTGPHVNIAEYAFDTVPTESS